MFFPPQKVIPLDKYIQRDEYSIKYEYYILKLIIFKYFALKIFKTSIRGNLYGIKDTVAMQNIISVKI
jgi:hypothetical protein